MITTSNDARILLAQDRSLMNNIAPPHGLFLWQVGYPGDPVTTRLDPAAPVGGTATRCYARRSF